MPYCKPSLRTYKINSQWRSVHVAVHFSLHGHSRCVMAPQPMSHLTQAGRLSLPSEETFNLPISLPPDLFKNKVSLRYTHTKISYWDTYIPNYYPFKIGTKFQELFSPKSFWLSDCQAPPLHVSYNVAFLIPGCELIHNYGKNKYTMCFTQTLQHYLPALSF